MSLKNKIPLADQDWLSLGWDEIIKYYEAIDLIEDEEERRQVKRVQARNDLYYLGVWICGRQDMVHPWVFARCRDVEREPNGYLDLWAREHFKSTIITFLLTIQDILCDPEITVGIFSHNNSLAQGFLRQIKQELENNVELKYLFDDILYSMPESQSPKWSEKDGIVVKREGNPKEPTVSAWGLVDGMPTGMHFGVLLYDDVVTEKSVTTPEMMMKTTEKWRLSDNLGKDGGVERYVGTIYHPLDTYNTMRKEGTVRVRIHPATADGSDDCRKAVRMTPEQLEKKRQKQGRYIFSCQMLLNPHADRSVGFQEADIQAWEAENLSNLNIFIIVDPASGKNREKGKGDYTTMWVLGYGSDENYYCIDLIRDRLKPLERAKKLMELHRKYRPAAGRVFYEETGMSADITIVKFYQEKDNHRFPIVPVNPRGIPKSTRIEALGPIFEAKRFYMPASIIHKDWEGKTVNNTQVFITEEYLAYPILAHDDMLDGLAYINDEEVKKRVPVPNPQAQSTVVANRMRQLARQARRGPVC